MVGRCLSGTSGADGGNRSPAAPPPPPPARPRRATLSPSSRTQRAPSPRRRGTRPAPCLVGPSPASPARPPPSPPYSPLRRRPSSPSLMRPLSVSVPLLGGQRAVLSLPHAPRRPPLSPRRPPPRPGFLPSLGACGDPPPPRAPRDPPESCTPQRSSLGRGRGEGGLPTRCSPKLPICSTVQAPTPLA